MFKELKYRYLVWKHPYFIEHPNYFTRNTGWSVGHWKEKTLEHFLWRMYYRLKRRK